MPRELDVVVAWHNENIRWITDHGLAPHVFLYNKGRGENPVPEGVSRVVQLPNVGREGHTYVRHILDNYDDLADVTYFLQGHPMDHCGDACQIAASRAPVAWFNSLGRHVVTVTGFKCPFWTDAGRDVTARMFSELFASAPPERFTFGAGALLAATRDAIRSRSPAFWRRCLAFMDHDVNPPEVYAMERLWGLVFDPSLASHASLA